jgi:hypothetical protein
MNLIFRKQYENIRIFYNFYLTPSPSPFGNLSSLFRSQRSDKPSSGSGDSGSNDIGLESLSYPGAEPIISLKNEQTNRLLNNII